MNYFLDETGLRLVWNKFTALLSDKIGRSEMSNITNENIDSICVITSNESTENEEVITPEIEPSEPTDPDLEPEVPYA